MIIKVYMDSIILESRQNDGNWIFTNHEEIKKIDEETGEVTISYVADGEWTYIKSE